MNSEREAEHHQGRGRQRPRLLGADQPDPLDLRRQQVGAQAALAQALDAQAVGHGERRQVVLELRGRLDLVAGQLVEALELLDLVAQVLLEELLQARQLEAVAQADRPCGSWPSG